MDKLSLKAEKRTIVGRKVKRLRRDGVLPANIYGKKIKSEAAQVVFTDFEKIFSKAGETGIIKLLVGGKEKPVLVHNVQLDPVSDLPIHVDFLQIDLKEKVTAEVPVELINESPAEKQGLGTIVQYVDEVEVEALPGDLPEKFEIDLTPLANVDDAVYIKNISADKKVDIKNDPEQIIVKVEPLVKEEEVVPPPPAEEAPPSAEGVSPEGEEKGAPPQETQEKTPEV